MRRLVNHMTASASLSPLMVEATMQETIKGKEMEMLAPMPGIPANLQFVLCLGNLKLLMKLPIGLILPDCFLTFTFMP